MEFESVRKKSYLSQIPRVVYSNVVVSNLSDLAGYQWSEDHQLATTAMDSDLPGRHGEKRNQIECILFAI